MLRERKDLRNSFFSRAVPELVWCGSRVPDVDSGGVTALLPDDYIIVVGVSYHERAFRLVR
jgi:hypothetical protein